MVDKRQSRDRGINNYCWHRAAESLSVIHTHIHTVSDNSLDAFYFPAHLETSVQTFCQAGVNLPLSWMDQSPNSTTQRRKDYHLHFRILKLKILPSLVNQVSEASVVSLNLGSFVYQVLIELIIVQQLFLTSIIFSIHYPY